MSLLITPLYASQGSTLIGGGTPDVDDDFDLDLDSDYEEWDYTEYEEPPVIYETIPDITIDYDKVNYRNAKYDYVDDKCIITYGGETYVVSGKDDAGFYNNVTIGGKTYSLTRYGKIANIDDFVYKGKEYEVDEDGFIVGYRREWVDQDINKGIYVGGYDNTKLLFREEVPFNVLWRHRPLTDEEKELLTTGPGVGLKTFSVGVSDNGTANVVIQKKNNTKTNNIKKKALYDPLNPMQAKSTKKQKD